MLFARGLCWWLTLWLSLCAGTAVAQVQVITQIALVSPQTGTSHTVSLPHFVSQDHSQLFRYTWAVSLPRDIEQMALPTMLLPQPVQGAKLTLLGETIYEFTGSDANTLRNWYRPVLISIPKHLLRANEANTITFDQSAHLRGWFIAPLLVGELQSLRPLYEKYSFISQTLSTTINLLSAVVGVFLFVIGFRTSSKNFRYAGLGILTWSILFTLALASEIPNTLWFEWRLLTYACTGLLIYFISMFMLEAFRQTPSPFIQRAIQISIHSGWVLFAWGGTSREQTLDIVWTAWVVVIYVITSAWVIAIAVRQREINKVLPVGLHWVLTSLFAIHDYYLQAGWLPIHLPTHTSELWSELIFQPIYLTHLALPAFVVMALWMLTQDHLQKTRREWQHEHDLNIQREKIVQDIHDGVGSRINLLLWGLRTAEPDANQIENELLRCVEELRFAINPQQAGEQTLLQALNSLCERLKAQCQTQGIDMQYSSSGSGFPIRSDLGLNLYKAVQECLSNALRHSQAQRIGVHCSQSSAHLSLIIEDNGRGIAHWDNDLQRQTTPRPTAMGLRSLQQRIQSKGGQLHIASGDQGTRITIRLVPPPATTAAV